MAAVRLRVILRAVITESRPPDLVLQHPRSTAFPIDRRARAVGPDSVNQPADRLPRDQSPVTQRVGPMACCGAATAGHSGGCGCMRAGQISPSFLARRTASPRRVAPSLRKMLLK